jgi:hypothetical protein
VRQVQVGQRAERHGELGVDVDPARRVEEQRAAARPPLDVGLGEDPEGLLEVDDLPPVLECGGRAGGVVHRAARDPVREVDDREDEHLPHDVHRATREEPRRELAEARLHGGRRRC